VVADQYAPRSREVEEYKKFAQVRLLSQGMGGLNLGGAAAGFGNLTYTTTGGHQPASYTSGAQMAALVQGIQKG
jgi:hypothetical protein